METEKSVMVVIRASRPSFRNNHDKVVFAIHASFLATGFVLTATGPPAFADDALSSSTTDEVGIDGWNEVEEEYAFVYVNPEKGKKKVLVKCLVMGDKLMVDALSEGASEAVHVDMNVDEFVAESTASDDYSSQYRNLSKLVSSLKSEVLSKLDGGSAGSLPRRSRASEDRSNPIGGSDLFPSGGAGIFPSRADFGGGSMLVGPQDPRWFGGGHGGAFSGIPGGPPPGARFDPYGPPGLPGSGPAQFGRYPRGPNRGSGTHPDLQPKGGSGAWGRIHPDLDQPGTGGFDHYM